MYFFIYLCKCLAVYFEALRLFFDESSGMAKYLVSAEAEDALFPEYSLCKWM